MRVYDKDKMKNFDWDEKSFLFNLDLDSIDIYDVIHKFGDYYAVCMISADKSKCAVHRMDEFDLDKDNEEFGCSNIKCPICGFEDIDSWEMSSEYDNDYQCGRCGAILQVQKNISVTYDSYVKELPEIKEVEDDN